MTLYRYDLLTPGQFEDLAILVAAAHFNASKFEMFGEGPDGGVDGTIEFADGNRLVRLAVQAKRHKRYPTARVIEDIQKFDASRFDGLLVVTSADPSPDTVDKTLAAFREHAPGNIYHHWTGTRLDWQINKDPACAINFPAIASYDSALHRLLQVPALKRGAEELSRIRNNKSLAATSFVDAVAETVTTRRVCIITGRPGVGKTTSALLAVSKIIESYRANGRLPPLLATLTPYDDVSIPFDTSLPIIFYYDDFLGSTSLTADSLRGNIREVLKLVGRCRTGENFLILTSRNYLIGDYYRAREESGLFAAFGINEDEACELECDSQLMRAQILAAQLHNHIIRRHNQLTPGDLESFKSQFLEERQYRKILRAEHFDPRALNVALEREQTLNSGTLERIVRGMADLHQQYKDGFLNLTEEEKIFLRRLLIFQESDGSKFLQFDDPVEITQLIRALEGIWVERVDSTTHGASERQVLAFRLANPSIREFLGIRFSGTRSELSQTWENAIKLEKPDAVFNILTRYLCRAENYSQLCSHLLRLAEDCDSSDSRMVIQKIVSIGVGSGEQTVRALANSALQRWLVENPEDTYGVDSSFYVDILRLTDPGEVGSARSSAVIDFLRSADVDSTGIDDLIYITEWVLEEPSFIHQLAWVERELAMEWDGLLQDVEDRPQHYDSRSLDDEAVVFGEIASTFSIEWPHSSEDLAFAHEEALEYRRQFQEYMVNMGERPRHSSSTRDIHALMSNAFRVDT